MLTPKEIAGALKTTRTEFARIFWKAQTVIDLPGVEKVEFEAVALQEPDDKKAFEIALQHADEKAFLFVLIVVATNSGLENGLLSKFIVDRITQNNAELQAMSNPPAGFTEPLIFSKSLLKCSQMTGKVMINGAPQGTGILISPNLFLTAWHVIRSMFDNGTVNAEGETIYAKKEPLPSLVVEFNSMLDLVGGAIIPTGSIQVTAHKDWLVSYSPCHNLELIGQIPADTNDFGKLCDYAIIRLSRAIGFERRWIELFKNNAVENKINIVLFQHPNGVPLKMDYSKIVRVLPGDPPPHRFLHWVNAQPGSSGGPCFDKEFSLVGIHQGEWPEKIDGITTNRGVPLAPIIKHLTATYPKLPSPDPADCPVWCLDRKSLLPVLGYDDFQSDVWKFVIPGQKRIATSSGNENSGKTWLMNIIFSVLPDDEHLKITLEGDEIAEKSALEIVKMICDKIGVAVPAISAIGDFTGTRSTWLRDIVIEQLIETINTKRDKRTVWICIKDLNHISINGEDASDFLFGLYDCVIKKDWLRILLDGMRADIPDTVKPWTTKFRTRDIREEEIINCLRRGVTELNLPLDGNAITILARLLNKRYQKILQDEPGQAMAVLADESQAILLGGN